MKFINYLESITGVGIYPIISLLVFTTFFVGCLIYVFKVEDSVMDEIKQIPLED